MRENEMFVPRKAEEQWDEVRGPYYGSDRGRPGDRCR